MSAGAETDVLTVLNRRTCIGAVRQAATQLGADPERLLDSQHFYDRVMALDPDDPGYMRQIHEAVQAAAMAPAANQAPPPTTGQSPGTHAARDQQWTIEDVERASPAEVVQAGEAGLLRDLGYGPQRRRR